MGNPRGEASSQREIWWVNQVRSTKYDTKFKHETHGETMWRATETASAQWDTYGKPSKRDTFWESMWELSRETKWEVENQVRHNGKSTRSQQRVNQSGKPRENPRLEKNEALSNSWGILVENLGKIEWTLGRPCACPGMPNQEIQGGYILGTICWK